MSQPHHQSWLESAVNVGTGLVINLTMQVLIFPLFGIHVPFSTNLGIAAVFTVVAVLRNYCIRRLFNRAASSTPSPTRPADDDCG